MAIPQSALVVDDETHIRVFVKMLLKQLGVPTIHEADSLVTAREQYAAHAPELIMLDLNMRGGSGMEVLSDIREKDPDTYVVMLSADTSAGTVKAAADAGADGFFRKDLSPQQMLAELRMLFADME